MKRTRVAKINPKIKILADYFNPSIFAFLTSLNNIHPITTTSIKTRFGGLSVSLSPLS
jgi:hypothetical protein